MLPSLVAAEVRETLIDYLRTTWSLSDRKLEDALFRFLESDRSAGGSGIFQGPYLRIRLPFEPAPSDAHHPLDLEVDYTPYKHQLDAWQRLSSKDGREPQPTLVVTGTGSGKTEAFLLPILDHCLRARRRGEKGIKAIVLYPMNALAADQARRIAKMVWGSGEDQPLRGKLRVGMYVGGEGQHRVMGPKHVIDDRRQLRNEPPDLLLTNYKMLDFLLLRPSDRRLWEDNRPETLRYLVLDELHTYDGAQGSDVACLVRRLAERLGGSSFCPVGTSATVTSEDGSGTEKLLTFASTIFGQPFEKEAIVGETRRTPASFFGLFGPSKRQPLPSDTEPIVPTGEDSIESFVARAAQAFFPKDETLLDESGVDRAKLGDRLARHELARKLIALSSSRIATLRELDSGLTASIPEWAARTEADRRRLLDAMLAMISWARRSDAGKRLLPLVNVQVQSWIREVRHLVRVVSEDARFRWRDETPSVEGELSLPMYSCRSCGHSGWVSVHQEITHRLSTELGRIGRAVLYRSADVVYLHRDESAVSEAPLPDLGDHVCPRCARLGTGDKCTSCGGSVIALHAHRATSKQVPPRDLQRCPSCGTDGALSMLASRAASLASVAIGHLYTTPFNRDRKLLAFSDSVQDASHRAGFFSGRTYRFSLRTAMLAVVPREGSIPLTSMPDAMFERWGDSMGVASMVAAFMPRDLDYLAPYVTYVEKIRAWRESKSAKREPAPPKRLMDVLRQRIRWEVTRELGLAARIGRTLERVGSASVLVDEARFTTALERVRRVIPNRLGEVQNIEPDRWRIFVAGLLARLRLRGGVFDELLRLYFQRQGHGKFLSKRTQELLSPFGRFTSRPTFLTNAPEPPRFDTIHPPKRDNWYTDWARRALAVPLSLKEARDLYAELLPLLVEARLFVAHRDNNRVTWGLDPEALHVARDPTQLSCDICNYAHASLEADPADLRGATCLRFRCDGSLQPLDADRVRTQTYYRRFYERGELGRVWAREHTGLLERDVREDLEADFKERHRPDAPNLLSCTPTLEMGIDIGDLSATMLVSVPPTTSSYLQRIGRAGRETGNALVLTFTTVRPHDLYFFDDPRAAMEGPVEPPGCYVDAPAILERQALAWCFDSWAREGAESEGLPARVREVFFGEDKKRFPAPFFRYIEPRREGLRESFLAVFGTSESTRAALQRYLSGSGFAASPMEQRLALLIDDVRRERDDLRRLHRRVKEKLKALGEAGVKVENADEERAELEREKLFIERELAAMQNQSLLGLLCSRSLLPNYAFPETGVQLRAYVSKDSTGGGPPGAERYEWVRAASTAIRELAPFNTFYGMARKVRIDTIDVGSGRAGRRGENIERWQLCSECGHMVPQAKLTSRGDCPRCGADDWREQGRRRELIRMARVSAFARQRDAAFSDESEDRQRELYVTETYFDPDPATAKHAWLDRKTPFGFELLPSLKVREINFGRLRASPSSQRIGGRDVPDVEFVVCEECGQVRDDNLPVQFLHRRWCTARAQPLEKQPWRGIHLFREITTEALRIFVPVSMLDPEVRLPNVRATFELGMRHFFGGAPEHLRVQPYGEPSRDERSARRRFVVIHDIVPGGTGVLTELAEHRGAKLRRVLELARSALETCPCRETDARACYRCLYAYRHQDDLAVLDREVALELVEQLLGGFEHLEPVDTISVLDTATVLESELEQRFVAELTRWVNGTEGALMERVDEARWRLTIADVHWILQAQVDLDPAHDVSIRTRPDFVFWPEGGAEGTKPVAVYCDGAAYHVQPHELRARLADDFMKREAVRRSGRFRVCSLTWSDLDVFSGSETDIGPWVEREDARATVLRAADSLGGPSLESKARDLMESDPLSTLLAYLADPEPLSWERAGVLAAVGCLLADQRSGDDAILAWGQRLASSEGMPAAVLDVGAGDHAWTVLRPGGFGDSLLLLHALATDLPNLLDAPTLLKAVLRLDDRVERRATEAFCTTWRTFLRAHVALQSLPGLEVVTTEQLMPAPDLALDPAPTMPIVQLVAEAVRGGMLTTEAHDEILIADDRCREAIERAILAGASLPSIPYEHGEGETGFDAQIEVGWPGQNVGLCLPSEAADAEALRSVGWTVLSVEDLDLDELLVALSVGAKR